MRARRQGPGGIIDIARIRRARAGDAPAIARLVHALNRQQGDHESRNIAGALVRDALSTRRFIDIIVALLDEKIVGYALFTRAYETSYATRGLYLNDLYVAPAQRRRGIGRALLAAVAREGKRREVTFLWWASRPWNQDAHRFYAALGARMEPVFAHAITHRAFRALAAGGKKPATHKAKPRAKRKLSRVRRPT